MELQLEAWRASDLERLIPLLRCVECGFGGLFPSSDSRPEWPELRNVDLSDEHLRCGRCHAAYPITRDQIPILLAGGAIRECFQPREEGLSPLAANSKHFDRIADEYAAFLRQARVFRHRMKHAAARLTDLDPDAPSGDGGSGLIHLDVGCGPGNLLRWLGDFGFQQVGLDVSLATLRHARKCSGAMVVLGSADATPFKEQVFDLITASCVLHHIPDWRLAVREACRVCRPKGGIVLDSEPSCESLDWSLPARAVFASRWYAYKAASYWDPSKRRFRNIKKAKQSYYAAEVHKQPGTGIPAEEVRQILESADFSVELVRSPDEKWEPQARLQWRPFLLSVLSGKNPFNPLYGPFGVMARRTAADPVHSLARAS